MLLMIDNYDSFTYNLVQYLGELGADVRVFRNDEIGVAGIEALAPEQIVISPGPCTPNEAGISVAAIQHFAGSIPLLGVCLGHQSIGQAFGGRIVHAREVMHGKTSPIHHGDTGVFSGLDQPLPGDALSFSGNRKGQPARLPGDYRLDRTGRAPGRDHGAATSRVQCAGGSVSSGIDPHPAGP